MTCRACGARIDDGPAEGTLAEFFEAQRKRPPALSSRSVFCSYACRDEFRRRQARQQYANWKRSGGLERRHWRRQALKAAALPVPDPLCQHCGERIAGAQRKSRRFCSGVCRVRAHRANPQAAQ
jgi:hypothetical protein